MNTNKSVNYVIPWVVACALFMENLDATIISTAIPVMAKFFQVDAISLKFATTSYLLSLAIFIPISGYIAEKFGIKKVFISAFVIFTFSSTLCALATNLWELTTYRILQGIGGAILMPVGRLLLLKIYPRADLIKVTNYVTLPALLGPMLGPLVGGIITSYFKWQWIFIVNVPIGLIAVIIGCIMIPNIKPIKVKTFDALGFVLFSLGIFFITIFINLFDENIWSLDIIIWVLLFGLFFLLMYFFTYNKIRFPILNLAVFRFRTFRVTVFGSIFSRIGIGGFPFILPLFFQIGHHLSPLISGLLTFPLAVAMFCGKFLIKPLIRKFYFRKTLIINTLCLGFCLCCFILIQDFTNYLFVVILVLCTGIFYSIQLTCMNVLTYADLPEQLLSQGTSIASCAQQLSMSFGVVFSAICLRYFKIKFLILHEAFAMTFITIGLFTICVAIIFTFLKNSDGEILIK